MKLEKRIETEAKRHGPVQVTDADFHNTVSKNSAVVIDFWADWCGPCRALAPRIEELAKKCDGKIFVGKVDVDQNPRTADSFNVRSIPTLVLLRNGEEVDRIIGCVPRRRVEEAIRKAFDIDICGE
jgi:thioredoxin 1